MRANGVARTVIIQVIHYKWDNSFLASVLKRYPTLFHGVCRVNPEDPAAPDELSSSHRRGISRRPLESRGRCHRRLDSWAFDAAALASLQ